MNGVDESGNTALIYAARYGEGEAIEYLLSKGTDVNYGAAVNSRVIAGEDKAFKAGDTPQKVARRN